MVCPTCNNQAVQYNGMGDGYSSTDEYHTYTIQECKKCGIFFMEFYAAVIIEDPHSKPDFKVHPPYLG